MKKMMSLLMVICMALVCIAGCGATESNTASVGDKEDKISIVTTIFPEYDWVREITAGNDNVEITMLLDNGVDLHSYQPTVDDIVKVSSCDMFIYVGGESDEWVEDALAEAVNKDMVVINLLDVLGDGVKEEEVVEGMEAEEEEEDGEEEEEGPEMDEHVWLSVKNAKTLSAEIAKQMETIDSVNKELYQENVEHYATELDELDARYANTVAAGNVDTVLFGDRFPFRYLVDDYNLSYYAAFVGCSAESEASFETITFLAKKVDELGLKSVLQIESADGKISETICENTNDKNQVILTMNSMQSTTAQDVADGATYLKIMEENCLVLGEALK